MVGHCLNRIEQKIAPNEPEHRGNILAADRLARERDDLIELALGVTHAAFGVARDQLKRFVANHDAFCIDNASELQGDGLRPDRPELIHLRS